jgi:hypothetical protein
LRVGGSSRVGRAHTALSGHQQGLWWLLQCEGGALVWGSSGDVMATCCTCVRLPARAEVTNCCSNMAVQMLALPGCSALPRVGPGPAHGPHVCSMCVTTLQAGCALWRATAHQPLLMASLSTGSANYHCSPCQHLLPYTYPFTSMQPVSGWFGRHCHVCCQGDVCSVPPLHTACLAVCANCA